MKAIQLLQGQLIDHRYEVVRSIGEGGMGAVYLVEDRKLRGKRWALKISTDVSLEQEAKFVLRFNHACLPRIVDYSKTMVSSQAAHYLVMDYIEGKTLKELFEKQRGQLSVRQILAYAYQLSECLNYLHGQAPQPIIYRDLKPANVMIDTRGQLKLIDFGIARLQKPGQIADTLQWGTIGFVSPEQMEGKPTDTRADLFSLGAMMYYLLTEGRYYMWQQLDLHQVRPDLPEAFCQMVMALLSHDPEQRPDNAGKVSQQLRVLLQTERHTSNQKYRTDDTVPAEKVYVGPQRIVIGGLFTAAGATYTALAASRLLNGWKIKHALIEHPCQRPELFGWTGLGEEAHEHKLSQPVQQEYIDEFTFYYPLSPDWQTEQHSADQFNAWLLGVKQPVCLVDISNQWEAVQGESWFQHADQIWIVAEPHVAKYNSVQAQQLLRQCESWRNEGKSIHLIANRQIEDRYYKQWLRALPMQPSAMLALLPYEQMLRLYTRSMSSKQAIELAKQYDASLRPLLEKVLQRKPKPSNRATMFSKLISQK